VMCGSRSITQTKVECAWGRSRISTSTLHRVLHVRAVYSPAGLGCRDDETTDKRVSIHHSIQDPYISKYTRQISQL